MTRGGQPAWIDEEPELRYILVELIALRRRGVWGLRSGGASIPTLEALGLERSPQVRQRSQYEAVRALFEEHVYPALTVDEQAACSLYFDLAGTHSERGVMWRREATGMRYYMQGSTKFRDPHVGKERTFLTRVARVIHGLRHGFQARPLSDEVQTYLAAQLGSHFNRKYRDYHESERTGTWWGDWVDGTHEAVQGTLNEARHLSVHGTYENLEWLTDESRHLPVFGDLASQLVRELATHISVIQLGGEHPQVQRYKLTSAVETNLTEDVLGWVPVYLPGVQMRGAAPSFPHLLAQAAGHHIAGMLKHPLRPDLFSTPPEAAEGWLLLVDFAEPGMMGLTSDEQSDHIAEVMQVIHHHLHDPLYRFVFASARPLDDPRYNYPTPLGVPAFHVEEAIH